MTMRASIVSSSIADKGHANVDVDHQAFVQDRVDDICKAVRSGTVQEALRGCDATVMQSNSL
jgi:hypothetical protein